jgi:GNAT superfamily N-acetyltransferase
MNIQIRNAGAGDVPLLKRLIDEMSEYERLPLNITEETLMRDGFTGVPKFRVLLAFGDEDAAGYAFVHGCYSSFQGAGLFLEDLFVRASFRGKRIGRALLAAVARLAIDEKCFGVVLNVLEWNAPAFAFFARAGAVPTADRSILCIERNRLADLIEWWRVRRPGPHDP